MNIVHRFADAVAHFRLRSILSTFAAAERRLTDYITGAEARIDAHMAAERAHFEARVEHASAIRGAETLRANVRKFMSEKL